MSGLRKIDEAWLKLDDLNESELINPFDIVNFSDEDDV